MKDRFKPTELLTARFLIWAALSALVLWYVRWGSEIIALRSYYHIRHSVPYLWNKFHAGLPEIGNERLLDFVYWSCIGVVIAGVLALFWLALTPSAKESTEPTEKPSA